MINIQGHKENYLFLFKNYPVFHLFLEYAFNHTTYELYINDEKHPSMVMIHIPPAFVFAGVPDERESISIQTILPNGAWIVSPNESFDRWLIKTFCSRLQSHPRILFDGSFLKPEELNKHINAIPEELSIVPIEEKHLQKGMIKEEIIDRFFANVDFLEHGFGFALVNTEGVIHGFAVTNYPIGHTHDIEVSYRVGYDSYTKYRKQGIGTTLASLFLIDTIKRGYRPIWDAANPVSVHIAKKLGYVESYHWTMFHMIEVH